MQVIYKIDVVFLWIYSSIILAIGIIGGVSMGSISFPAVMLGVELVYLFFALRRPYRRGRAVSKPFPEEWKVFLANYSLFYKNIDDEAKKRFERDIRIFLSDFSIEGTQRGEVDMETRLLVATGAAALIHGRPDWEPPIPDGVLVYPGRQFNRHYQSGRGFYAGMATHRGPLILTEGSLEASFQNPHDGHNVIYHELAHYFDMESGSSEWKDFFTREWEDMFRDGGEPFLRSYAGTNEAEFFAVATEAFFEKPLEMKEKKPKLYNALKEFYNLDTAEIIGEE